MSRVKRFFQVAKSVLALLGKLLPLVGDTLECIKVVDSLVDSFIEKRKNGELKDVDFITYATKIIDLVGEIAPLGYTFIETMEMLVEYVHKFAEQQKNAELYGEPSNL